jgi:3-hydroxyisobutyrate dehydrogenase-like beta-hydroxyacid dehydrogenase
VELGEDNHVLDDHRSAVGFVGLGVMGEPMCRNIAVKSGRAVFGLDKVREPLARLARHGVTEAGNLGELAQACGVIVLSLPSGEHVAGVCEGEDGLLNHMTAGQTLVDMSTSPVELTRRLAAAFAERGVRFADAPIARTRQAAEDGTLSIMVGGDLEVFAAIEPLLACCGTDITHCGPVGSGQVVKILNNMVMVETVVALSEALAIGRRSGVDGKVLFETLTKGSGDSFALRNHGMKSVLPGVFPEQAFSAVYARKDLAYALELAASTGVAAEGALHAADLLDRAIEVGDGQRYWPVISRVVEASSRSGR